jgi:hypothetical protein
MNTNITININRRTYQEYQEYDNYKKNMITIKI